MKLTNKRIKMFGIFLVVSIIVIGIGITYAFFIGTVVNAETSSTILIDSADYEITYYGGENPNVTGSFLAPGWSSTKTFKITSMNKTSNAINYEVNIKVLDSNFFTAFSNVDNRATNVGSSNLMYSLGLCDSNYQNCNLIVTESVINKNNPNGTSNDYLALLYTQTIPANSINLEHYYKLTLSFPDLSDVVQTQRGVDNEHLRFSGHVFITSSGKLTLDESKLTGN